MHLLLYVIHHNFMVLVRDDSYLFINTVASVYKCLQLINLYIIAIKVKYTIIAPFECFISTSLVAIHCCV